MASTTDAGVVGAVKDAAERFPGPHDLVIVISVRPAVAMEVDSFTGETRTRPLRSGPRRLTLGPEWRCDGTAECVAALGEFGRVVLREG